MAKKPCQMCGRQITVSASSLPQPTCQPCRASLPPRKSPRGYQSKKTACATCGVEVWKARKPAADGLNLCRPCRLIAGRVGWATLTTCAWCSREFQGGSGRKYCGRECFGKATSAAATELRAQREGPQSTHRRRKDRARSAPGLTIYAQRKLLHKWRAQGRSCAFCGGPCDSVEHLTPLTRGGTNYEGNLAPCCTPCNSRKGYRLVVEFKWSAPPSNTVHSGASWLEHIEPPRVAPAKPKRTPLAPTDCYICGGRFTPRSNVQKTCGGDCSREHTNRQMRERYRARAGLAPTWDQPSRRRAA